MEFNSYFFNYLELYLWRRDEYSKFKPVYLEDKDGYIQPYNDIPIDKECVGEIAYLNLINRANKSIYIITTYLIIDNEMGTALKNRC